MGFSYLSAPLYESKLKFNAARVEESLQNSLQHHDLGIRLWRHAGMGSKEDKELKEGQVWYVNITFMILGEVGDEITMDKHQSKTLGKEVERIKTIRVKEGATLKVISHPLKFKKFFLQLGSFFSFFYFSFFFQEGGWCFNWERLGLGISQSNRKTHGDSPELYLWTLPFVAPHLCPSSSWSMRWAALWLHRNDTMVEG